MGTGRVAVVDVRVSGDAPMPVSAGRDPELQAISAEIEHLERDVRNWTGTPLQARAKLEGLRGWFGLCRERLARELQDILAERRAA